MTVLQIHVLLGLSDCDGDGIIPYREFSKICAEYIKIGFSFETQIKKQQIMKMSMTSETDKVHPAA